MILFLDDFFLQTKSLKCVNACIIACSRLFTIVVSKYSVRPVFNQTLQKADARRWHNMEDLLVQNQNHDKHHRGNHNNGIINIS